MKRKKMSNKITKVSVHPFSRKSNEKRRMMLRAIKLTNRKSTVTHAKHIPLINRLTWFQLYLAGTQLPTLPEIQEAIREYVDRNKEEIGGFRSALRKDRPVPKKMQEMEELRSQELVEFSTAGIELPKMISGRDFAAFQKWSGDYNSISQLQMTKYKI